MNPPSLEVLRVLVTDPLHADGLQALQDAEGIELIDASSVDEAQWRPALATIHAWIIRSGTTVHADHLAAAPLLRVVGRAGVGVDNVDVATATARGVLVMNAPDANSTTTAELAIAHLMAMARHLVRGDRMVREGDWRRKELIGTEIEGKTLGVVGLGRIGRKVASKGGALGMKVLAYDPYVAPAALEGSGIQVMELDELLPQVDFLSLHLPMNATTRGLIGAAQIAKMPARARLINCARGGLIDEAALAEALHSGHLAGAALDVFEHEPPAAEHPLLHSPGLSTTPHLGASTREASRKVSLSMVGQVLDCLRARGIRNAVNLPPLDPATMTRLQPWSSLAERCGRMLGQLADWPLQRVRVEMRGEELRTGARLLSTSFLSGLLQTSMDRPVNLVNALAIAKERGLQLDELYTEGPHEFSSLLRFEVEGPQGKHSLGGALFGDRTPRVILLDDARLELTPRGHLLVLRNQDRPGVIGRIGTLLGESGHNISSMSVTPPAADGLCWAVLSVSEAVPEALRTQIASIEGIRSVRRVDLS